MNPQKKYAIDPGLVRALTLNNTDDLGRLFENVIYLDLRRLNCKINYYITFKNYEIDFLITTPRGTRKLFQVVWHMENEKTFIREKRALDAAISELGIDGQIITLESYLKDGINIY
mgnify:CR=1 FL=1